MYLSLNEPSVVSRKKPKEDKYDIRDKKQYTVLMQTVLIK